MQYGHLLHGVFAFVPAALFIPCALPSTFDPHGACAARLRSHNHSRSAARDDVSRSTEMQSIQIQEAVDDTHLDILRQLQVYLDAIYNGTVDALRSTFHPAALLFGEVRGEIVQKSLDAYLKGVASRKSPASQNEPYGMSVLSVEVVGKMASAKVRVRMAGFNYYDFLSLLRVDRKWVIVNKLYTHIEE
jgi:hypothetical protein